MKIQNATCDCCTTPIVVDIGLCSAIYVCNNCNADLVDTDVKLVFKRKHPIQTTYESLTYGSMYGVTDDNQQDWD